jgi:Phage P2 GpU
MDGALGPVMFQGGLGSMNTFHSVAKTKKEVFAKHRIIQQVDIIEDTGADPIELSIQMHFHAPYTLAPSAALTSLEALMDAKVPVPLIIGSTPVGRGLLTLFVIEDISIKMSKFISSSLIIADIDVKLLEYPGALNLSGPLSALGGALPGLSRAVATITSAISGVTGALNIAATANGALGTFSQIGGTVGGMVGGVLNTLTGGVVANSLTSMLSSLSPGNVSQIVAPSAQMLNTALTNLRAAGH